MSARCCGASCALPQAEALAQARPALPAGVEVFERGWLSSNNIVLTGNGPASLVDSGYCTHAPQTLALVAAALAGRPLDRLVNTHLHSDHCGGNAALQARYGELQTLIPPGQADQVAAWDPVALTYLPTGQQCPRFGFDALLRPGGTIELGAQTWQVHAAKGHDPHSVVLFEPASRTLISADALWENGFGVVFPELEGERAFEAVADTLDMIEQLAPRSVIPGHGRVFVCSGEILGRARGRLEALSANPARHARHAAKVLIKFKLLETRSLSFDELLGWAAATAYFAMMLSRFFPSIELRAWIAELCDELAHAGAARREGDKLFDN